MKKALKITFFTLFFIVFFSITSFLSIIFFTPSWLLTSKNIDFVLKKTQVLKTWSWTKADITLHWINWNDRQFTGEIKNFCFEYENESMLTQGCFDSISWDYRLTLTRSFKVQSTPLSILKVFSPQLKITTNPSTPQVQHSEETDSLTLTQAWDMLFSTFIPDSEIHFDQIHFTSETLEEKIKLFLQKKSDEITTQISTLGINANLKLTPKVFTASLPRPTPLQLKKAKIIFNKTEAQLERKNETFSLHLETFISKVKFTLESELNSPIFLTKAPEPAWIKEVLLKTKLTAITNNIESLLVQYAPRNFRQLPTPLNVLTGALQTNLSFLNAPGEESITASMENLFRFKGGGQTLNFNFNLSSPLQLRTYHYGPIQAALIMEKVFLKLPRMNLARPIPQLLPDARFKVARRTNTKNPLQFDLHIEALSDQALSLKSNLLKNEMRFEIDLVINETGVDYGKIKLLPLNLAILKKPIEVKNAQIQWSPKSEAPLLLSEVKFKMPEYIIYLNLEGPLDQPRVSFKSEPALPEEDILSVLLYGKPLTDLSTEEQGSARRTTSLLSQGAFSLTSLYFLAGTSIESLGYDMGTSTAFAQVRLSDKYSLGLEYQTLEDEEYSQQATLRRSLGNGWFINSSIQNSSQQSLVENDFGVLLERVIAY